MFEIMFLTIQGRQQPKESKHDVSRLTGLETEVVGWE